MELLDRGTTRPHLLDWDRDGRTDLVVGHVGSWKLHVIDGPLPSRTDFKARAFDVPAPKGIHPIHFAFADWDGDGRLDLLANAQELENGKGPWRYGVYWLRNTSDKGEPAFAPPAKLLTIPKPWEMNAFAVVDHDQDGRLDVVASLAKDWNRKKGVGWTVDAKLWLYRRTP